MSVGIVLLLGLGSTTGALPVSTDPSLVTALLGSSVVLRCSFPRSAQGDRSLLVTWYFQDRKVAELDGIPISTRVGAILFSHQQGHTQASLLLHGVTTADQGPYRCAVHHSGQYGEGKVQLQVAALPQPVVYSTVVEMHEDSALVCYVRGFYPQVIAVSWFRDGQNLKASFISDMHQEHRDKTFSLVAVYRFTPMTQDLGALFSCRAWHPLLNQSRQADFHISFPASNLTIGLQVLLWVLRVALLLTVAGGAWLYFDTGSWLRKRVEQMTEEVMEWIWDPLRQRFQQVREVITSWSK